MASYTRTPLFCPLTFRWRVPTPQGWLYLVPNDIRFRGVSQPNQLLGTHAPVAYAGPTAESYTAAYNIAAASAAGYNISTDARLHWHYVENVGPRERWNNMRGGARSVTTTRPPAGREMQSAPGMQSVRGMQSRRGERRSITQMGAADGRGMDWGRGGWRTTGADGRNVRHDGQTAVAGRGGSMRAVGGSMVRRNVSRQVVRLNSDYARSPLGGGPSLVVVEDDAGGWNVDGRGFADQATTPIARTALNHSPGNGIIPSTPDRGNGHKWSNFDPRLW